MLLKDTNFDFSQIRSEKGIGAVVWNGQIGNPVIFHEKYTNSFNSAVFNDVGFSFWNRPFCISIRYGS